MTHLFLAFFLIACYSCTSRSYILILEMSALMTRLYKTNGPTLSCIVLFIEKRERKGEEGAKKLCNQRFQ